MGVCFFIRNGLNLLMHVDSLAYCSLCDLFCVILLDTSVLGAVEKFSRRMEAVCH